MIHKLLLISLISIGLPVYAGPSDDNHVHVEQVGGSGGVVDARAGPHCLPLPDSTRSGRLRFMVADGGRVSD